MTTGERRECEEVSRKIKGKVKGSWINPETHKKSSLLMMAEIISTNKSKATGNCSNQENDNSLETSNHYAFDDNDSASND